MSSTTIRTPKFPLASALAFLSAAGVGHAQEATDEVQITGQRLEETVPQELERYGNRVETIDDEQIQQGGYYDTAQALQALTPGLYIAPLSGAFDYVELSLQGSRTGEVLWLVDGMRINNRLYNTTTPLDTIPANMIERIEVLEGGQGLFYGTQSVAGAVNIVTKQFSEKPDGRVELGLDTNDGRHLNAYFRNGIGGHRFVVYASKDEADGFKPFRDQDYQPSSTDRERSYDVLTFNAKYAYEFGDMARISIGYQHTDAELDFARPRFFSSATNDRNEDLVTAKLDYTLADNVQVFLKGYYHDWDTLYNEIDNGDAGPEVISVDEFWGFKDYGVNLLTKIAPGGNLEYFLGYDYQHYEGQDDVLLIARDAETVNAPFAQIRTTPALFPNLRLALGARYNKPDNGQDATVWNFSGHWDINPALFLRTTLGTAFRLPDAYQLFAIDPCCEIGNPDLGPERSKNLNVSLGGQSVTDPRAFRWEAVAFLRDVDDFIDIVTDPVLGIDTFANVAGKTKVRGGEIILSGALGERVSARGSFTVTDAKADGSSVQIQEIPETLAKLSFEYTAPGDALTAGLDVNRVGNIFRNTTTAAGRINYGDYYVLDLNAGLRFGADKRHRIGLRLENALDEEYASRVRDIAPDDGGARYAFWFLGTPRTLHASYAYQF